MLRLRFATTVTAMLGTIGALAIALATPAEAVWPGNNGRIVFFKAGGTMAAPTAQIYSMKADGSDQRNLSAAGGGAAALDIQPSVSPDGKRVAFVRADLTTLSAQIWVMRIDGSQQTNISNDAGVANESGPAWSEDGRHVLFVKQPPGTFPGAGGSIWIRQSNGKGTPRQLTAGANDANPAMSPDGDLLAFSRPVGVQRHLFVMKADEGGGLTDLGPGSKPNWSPDSSRIVYGQAGTGPITVVKVADPSQRQVLTGPGNEAPVWSPDGTQIAFMDCTSGPTCQIALMTASGANQHDITNDQTANNQKPDWQARRGGDDHEGGGGDD